MINKIILFLLLVTPFISCKANSFINENIDNECVTRSDSEYKKLIVGKWSLNNIQLVNNNYSLIIEYGATGMVTLTMYDTNNALYNSAYGYFDIKNGTIAATFYSESNANVGLANGNPFHAEFICANQQQHTVSYNYVEFILNKMP